ncbi:MAG TPA: oxygenase MpaB family protein [Sphingobium sp.]|uniref:oxygenase MpaB family protein n=1 Tax=Sphingobium sp. TaxID=1912891 RepID=UPI002ED096E9
MKQKPVWLGQSDPHARLRRIEQLDPAKDYLEITNLFYADFQSVMLLKAFNGFMFTFAAPRISRVLGSTGEIERRIAKRVVDTTLLSSAVMQHGFGTPIGREAARRVNSMHSRYDIHDDDFVAVGIEEAIGSLDLAEKFGWRHVTEIEREGVRIFYSYQARAFGSPQPLPGSVPEMRAFFERYLHTQLGFEPQNRRMADAFVAWFRQLLPAPLRPMISPFLFSHLDPRIAHACGVPIPSAPIRGVAHYIMKRIGQRDPVPDGAPNELEEMVRQIYPEGYELARIGTHLDDDEIRGAAE